MIRGQISAFLQCHAEAACGWGLAAGGEQGPRRGTGSKSSTVPRPGGFKPPPSECILTANLEDTVREQPLRAAWGGT